MWLTYEPKVFMGNMEPPFPNWFEVMWSLKGPDRNKNGIRDDVEIYINNEFKDLNESELIMIYNYAVLNHKTLVLDSSSEYKEKYWIDYNINILCFSDYTSFMKNSDDRFGEKRSRMYRQKKRAIYHLIMNTYLRESISNLFLNKFHMWGFETGGLKDIHRELNTWKYCGFDKMESERIASKFLDNKFKYYKKFEILNFIKFYEDEYGKVNRNLYEKYLK